MHALQCPRFTTVLLRITNQNLCKYITVIKFKYIIIIIYSLQAQQSVIYDNNNCYLVIYHFV